MLSVFPALIALISIVGLVADPATITRVLTDTISQLGPSSAVETFKGPIESITANSGTAGLGLIIGLAGALWTASGYVGAFMRASNAIYEIEEGRPFWKLRPLQILVTLILELMLAIVVLGLIVSRPARHRDRQRGRRRRHRPDDLQHRQVAAAAGRSSR